MNKERNNIADYGCCFSFSVSTKSSLFEVVIGSHVSFQVPLMCVSVFSLSYIVCYVGYHFAVCLENVHQHPTKILPFDFNGYFSSISQLY